MRYGEAYFQQEGDAWLALPQDPHAAAQVLYAELRRLDSEDSVARIVVPIQPDTPAWAAIHDRLRRAAHGA